MVATRHVTIDEFAAMPLQGIWELVDGELIELTPAAGRSSRIGGRLYARLADHVEPNEVGWAFPAETGFVLFADRTTVRSPDAAVVRRDRLAEPPDSFVPLAPDLAVEVLSPSDRIADALAKIAMYLDAGVRLVWLVDPADQTVTIFRPDTTPSKLAADDALDGGDVLPDFRVPVVEIFR
ncbi:MAG TPA: Uma2 family endonuclease [Thermomicrobiales bacterium]|nr:Uma2 family endonuclease [Thermomicrobiales bacterium]